MFNIDKFQKRCSKFTFAFVSFVFLGRRREGGAREANADRLPVQRGVVEVTHEDEHRLAKGVLVRVILDFNELVHDPPPDVVDRVVVYIADVEVVIADCPREHRNAPRRQVLHKW